MIQKVLKWTFSLHRHDQDGKKEWEKQEKTLLELLNMSSRKEAKRANIAQRIFKAVAIQLFSWLPPHWILI